MSKTSKFKGVHRHKQGSYIAQIRQGNRMIYLGSYATEQKASEAYQKGKRELFVK